jgi:hypothetical protein
MAVTGDFKVGRSNDVNRRLGELQTACPHKLRVILEAPGLGHLERRVHQSLREYRCRYGKGEWFRETGFGQIPDKFYNMFSAEALEDGDWWKSR